MLNLPLKSVQVLKNQYDWRLCRFYRVEVLHHELDYATRVDPKLLGLYFGFFFFFLLLLFFVSAQSRARGGWTRSIIAESAILIAIDFEWDFFKLLLLWL